MSTRLADVPAARGLVVHVASVAGTLVHEARADDALEGDVGTERPRAAVRALPSSVIGRSITTRGWAVIALAEIASRALPTARQRSAAPRSRC